MTPEQVARLERYEQVKSVTQAYEVNWGGTSILDCELYLLQMALEQSEADYFHLISGQDYPTRPLSFFFDFFEKNKGKEFFSSNGSSSSYGSTDRHIAMYTGSIWVSDFKQSDM